MYEWIRRNTLIVRVDDECELKTEHGQAKALARVPECARRGHRKLTYDGILHREGVWAIFIVPTEPARRERLARGRGSHL